MLYTFVARSGTTLKSENMRKLSQIKFPSMLAHITEGIDHPKVNSEQIDATGGGNSRLDLRHSGAVNVLFIDGHVSSKQLLDIPPAGKGYYSRFWNKNPAPKNAKEYY